MYLNVYDLHESNEYLYPLGFGSFHSGVQVGGTEYTFGGGSGVFTHEAKAVPNAKFRESVFLGEYEGTSSEVSRAIDELRPAFPGSAYNILTKNCNHFSDALSLKLIGKPIPDYVNRLANIGGCFSCLLPPSLTSQAPVSDGPSGGAGTAFNGNGRRQVTASGVKPFAPSQGYKLGSGQSAGIVPNTDFMLCL